MNTSSTRWYALALLCTAFFMGVLDSTIVYTAVPTIAEELGFRADGVQWILTAYMLAFGGLLLFGGRTADLLGRRRMFMAGVGLFSFSSLLCGLAWSPTVLIMARALQGLSAAVLTPAGLSILMNTFEEGADRNKALGIWGSLGGIAATAGVLLGGPITDGLGWQWIFFINLPVGIAALILSPILLAESRDRDRKRAFDPAGAITITGGLVLLIYGISEGLDVLPLAGAAVLIALFVIIEARSAAPLVPLRIFRSRTLVGGNLSMIAAGMCIDGLLIIFTLYAQQVLGYSAMQFGLAMAVMTVSSFAGVAVSQHVATRVGAGPVAAAGMVLIGIGCLLLTQVAVDSAFFGVIFFGLIIFGPGLGAAFVSSQIAALSNVAERDSGLASGIIETSFTVGGALGIAVLSAVAAVRTRQVLAQGAEQAEALTQGFQAAYAGAAVIALLGLVAAAVLLRPRRNHVPEPEIPAMTR